MAIPMDPAVATLEQSLNEEAARLDEAMTALRAIAERIVLGRDALQISSGARGAPYVGRYADLATIEDVLHRAVDGRLRGGR